MPFTVKQDEQFERELIPAGNHHAVCFGVIDLGTHHGRYNGEPNVSHDVLIYWELPSITMEYEKDGVTKTMPKIIHGWYRLSLHEKANLYKLLVTWRSRAFTAEELAGFNLFTVIGANCLLNIIHKTKTNGEIKHEVSGASPLVAGMPKMEPKTDIWKYFIPEDQMVIPEVIPDWIRKKIGESDEHQMVNHAQAHFDSQADEIPAGYNPDKKPIDDIPF